jgi:hypothetical protein
MTCDIRLYDSSYNALSSNSVQLVPVDTSSGPPTTLSAAVQNGWLGGGAYGAHLSFAPSPCVYQVAITDSNRVYGSVTIPSLNGNIAGQLEVVLRRVPPRTSGGVVVRNLGQLRGYLANQLSWSDENRNAVLDIVSSLGLLRGSNDPTLRDFIGNSEYMLGLLGIDPSIV